MNSPQPSPGLRPTREKAPEPSAALLALQNQGLELPTQRNTSISVSPQSNPAYDPNLRVSPLSIISTPSNFRPSPIPLATSQASSHVWRRRKSSVDSVETTVSGIINLYTNLSKQSFRSEYEEVVADDNSDIGSIDDSPPLPMVHQPKAQAYRDTIAPLLEHQFSSTNLEVPSTSTPFPSPMSLASMPLLMHPDASPSVPSLRLTPDGSWSGTRAGPSPSDRSIQLTPEMSPPLPHSNICKNPIEVVNKSALNSHERKVNLEVPDVRDAESWYDEPLSPISPEDLEYRNAVRESQQSAVSPQSPNSQKDHFRALAFENLSPPAMNLKTSPGLRSVNVVDVEGGMLPPPLDLSRKRSNLTNTSTPAYESGAVSKSNKIQQDATSQIEPPHVFTTPKKNSDADLEAMKSFLSMSYERTSLQANDDRISGHPIPDDIDRPRSAFSDSSDSFIIYDTFSGQVKALWRDKFGKKKDKKSGRRKSTGKDRDKEKEEEKKNSAGPTMTRNVTTAFTDDPESYKYPYGLKRNTGASRVSKDDIQPAYKMTSPDTIDVLDTEQHDQTRPTTAPGKTRRSSEFFGQLSTFAEEFHHSSAKRANINAERDEVKKHPSAYRVALAQPAIPLTGYQKYGVEVWYESSKKKRRAERERLRKEAEKVEAAKQKTAVSVAMTSNPHSHGRGHNQISRIYPNNNDNNNTTSNLRLSGPDAEGSQRGFYRQAQIQAWAQSQTETNHIHQLSTDSAAPAVATIANSEAADDKSQRHTSQKPVRRSGTSSIGTATGATPMSSSSCNGYNNDLFEASGGGRKKSGLASRLLMSSEERRKNKVKESITIVGGGRMADGGGGAARGEGRGLVKI